MCILEHTTFHYCSHFERVLNRCQLGTCINEVIVNFPGLSNQIHHVVSSTHGVCAACRWADLERDTPPPKTGNSEPADNEPVDKAVNNEPVKDEPVEYESFDNESEYYESVDYDSDESGSDDSGSDDYESDDHEPAEQSQKYILKRAQAKILPNIGLRVATTCAVIDTTPGSYRDGIEVKVRTMFPFVNPRVLANHDRLCRACSQSYLNLFGTVNEEVVQLRCRHTIGVRCAQYLIERMNGSNEMVEDPRRSLKCPFCGDVVFAEPGGIGEDISLRRNRGWRRW